MKILFRFVLILCFFSPLLACSGNSSSSDSATDDTTDSSSDASLSELTLTSTVESDLNPVFDTAVFEYTAQVSFLSDYTFEFIATTTNEDAELIVNEALATSGEVTSLEFEESINTAEIVVVAPDASESQEYSLSVSRNPLAQTTLVKATDPNDEDYFAHALALSGDTLVVGALLEDGDDSGTQNNAGAIYVYTRTATDTWEFTARLEASNLDADDQFGGSVAIDGDVIVVGAANEDGSATSVNGTDDDAVSASGAAYVFEKDENGDWLQTAYLKGSALQTSDHFGNAVAVSGDTIAVGAYRDDGTSGDSGAVYVFVKNGDSWEEQGYLKADTIDAGDEFGQSVALDGDTLVVGAHYEDGSAIEVNGIDDDNVLFEESGAAYIFERDDTTWTQTAYLKASNNVEQIFFGNAVSVSNDVVAVSSQIEGSDSNTINGNANHQSASGAGAVYTYVKNNNGDWVFDSYIKAPNSDENDRFGCSIALQNDILVVGALGEDSASQGIDGDIFDNTLTESGSAYIFRYSTTHSWEYKAYLKASNSGLNDSFGRSVSISNDTVVVGSRNEDGSLPGIDPEDDDAGLDTGALYIFR